MHQPTQPQEIKPGIYKHYKGGIYRVRFIATHSETLEKLVVYEMIEDTRPGRTYGPGSIWVRPLTMFTENVEWEGKTVPRFAQIKR